ncbi:NAD(P)-dependent dehydrogenase (short-subunit alcohol dehydrogenase family) [Mycobacterium sp. OAS707]|uniref:SDR family NAD(P)-dependent oxidoreductase n=1 Tax=Mycobacterium sp. OAS707 TaxID=2663822 RepID=UPI00178AD1D0|nr:SDR family NAD(P)-dependent oxidoreductase [Mycobacterium sp. OAS707]MBE1547389.1 NAD(P)-dependent dehydrogenase (short-subunit alcohol dehydrogenase family) [Mycobacterium sp. OAS707]
MTTIVDKTVLITGGNRGIGRALVEDALRRGARKVYVGTRKPVPNSNAVPVQLDVTDEEQIQRAVAQIGSLDVLVNNAGIADYDDLSDQAALQHHLDVNLFGTYRVTQAFLPLLSNSRGSVVNNLSVNALAPLPLIPAYSVSKAAAFSLTQSQRTLLADRGITVHAVLTGIVDTDMTRGLEAPKASPESVARAIFDGVENGEEDIFPDAMSVSMAQGWRSGPAKALERQYAALAAAELAKAQANSG